MVKEGHPIRNGTIATVVGGILLAIITWALGYLPVVLGWANSVLDSCAGFLGKQVSISVWLLCLVIVCSLGAIPGILLLVGSLTRPRERSWTEYTRDLFFEVEWRWRYDPATKAIRGLHPLCPLDSTQLMETVRDREFFLHCETCGQLYGPMEEDRLDVEGKVERQIHRKIRTGEWIQSQQDRP